MYIYSGVTLRTKIIIIFTVIIVLPLVIATVLVTNDLGQRAKNEITRQAENAFNIFKRYLKAQVRYNEINLKNLSLNQNLKDKLSNNLTNEAGIILTKYSEKNGLYKIDILYPEENNNFEARIFSNKLKVTMPDSIDFNSLNKGGVSSAYMVSKRTNDIHKSLFIVSVLKNIDPISGKPFFIRMVRKFKKNFIDDFKELLNLDLSIYYKQISILTTFLNADGIRIIDEKLKENQKSALNNKLLEGIWNKHLGREYLSFYRKLEFDNKISLEISIPKENIKQTNNLIVKYLISLLIMSLILALLAGIALSKNIVGPIKILSDATREISEGELNLIVEMDRNDEIGYLAKDFNKMTHQLKESYSRIKRKVFEITTLFEISKNMSFVNDTDVLVEIIVDKAISSLNAQRGSLMLFNEEIDKLEVKVVRGFSGVVKSYTKLSPGEGIAGKVFSSKQGMLVNYGEDDPMFMRSKIPEKDNKINSLICVPMKAKDVVIGVINIVNKQDNTEFNADDMNLLNAIASQAAMAIENAKLYEQSITDGMTKLFIHRYFQVRLEEELNRASRYGSTLSLIMFDVDHFKKFNDTYGHQTGDVVLKEVAKTIKDTIRRDVDIAARYGGEEFTIIVPETTAELAFKLAERLRIRISEKKIPGPAGETLSVNISLGISEYPKDADKRMPLIKCADTALYYAKENGRNQTSIYNSSMIEQD